MNTILHDFDLIVSSLVQNYLKSLGNKSCLSDFTDDLNVNLMNLGKQITSFVILKVEQLLFESKDRKKEYNAIDIEGRKLITLFGELEFDRRYYECKQNGEKVYLLDKYLDIKKKERILPNVEEKMLNEATETNYQKAGKLASFNTIISKQTVKNKISMLNINQQFQELDEKKKISNLYIEADEDHVHLQQGGIAMPLLVSVYENKINGKVINKKCFGGIYKGNSSKLWEEVSDYIDNTYDVSFLKNVFIIGDCANWIKSATEYICKSKIVIDKFHFRQAVKILVKNSSEYEKNILDAIYSLNFDKFKQEAMFMISEEMNKTVRENKLRLITYIINNKQGIKNMFCYDLPGCSAEGQISHIYSRRMSTIPCGWSITNVDKMSRMRVLKENKGNIKEYIRKEKELIELDIHQKKAYNIVKESSKKIINNNWVDTSDIINLNKEYEEELREIFKYRSI